MLHEPLSTQSTIWAAITGSRAYRLTGGESCDAKYSFQSQRRYLSRPGRPGSRSRTAVALKLTAISMRRSSGSWRLPGTKSYLLHVGPGGSAGVLGAVKQIYLGLPQPHGDRSRHAARTVAWFDFGGRHNAVAPSWKVRTLQEPRFHPAVRSLFAGNDCFRRVSPVAPNPGEGLLTGPTAGVQPERRRLMCGNCRRLVVASRDIPERLSGIAPAQRFLDLVRRHLWRPAHLVSHSTISGLGA